jgi:beta-aspartyl-peptidase (threonine type)
MRHTIPILALCFWLLTTCAWAEGRWAIAIHGGAGYNPADMAPERVVAVREGLELALQAGVEVLESGGSALDCVEKVVRVLEDRPEFNAGKGAVFNSEGKHELDAAIMDGRDRACGAVAGVRTVRNPVSLARKVMSETRHVMLAGDGAEQFATEQGVERVDNGWFDTPESRQAWEHSKGTVGCVALDQNGNLAAATSTGGLSNKKWGRIGDSPVIGAGTYADDRSCAVSCTGTGEEYIRRSIAHDISARMLYGQASVGAAAQAALDSLPPDTGGLIVVGRDGTLVLLFNTTGMARGAANSEGRFDVGLGRD